MDITAITQMPVIDTWVNMVKADAESVMRREDDRHVNFYLLSYESAIQLRMHVIYNQSFKIIFT